MSRVVYLGPVAPHWDVQSDFGPPEVVEQFRERVLARLVLLPPHDPQFRRNRERVVRDAERENLALEWVSLRGSPRPERPLSGRAAPLSGRCPAPILHPASHSADTAVVKALRSERSVGLLSSD